MPSSRRWPPAPASLPDRAPVADLWAGVSQRLTPAPAVLPFNRPAHRRFSFTLPQLVAAGLALMLLSGGMVWVARLGDPRTSLPSAVAQVAPDEGAPRARQRKKPNRQARCLAWRLPTRTTTRRSRTSRRCSKPIGSRLDPETVRILEANLQTIDQAIEQSRKALRADPANVYLNNHFAASRNRKIALLRRASALAMTQDAAGGS